MQVFVLKKGCAKVERKDLSTIEFECLINQADRCKNDKIWAFMENHEREKYYTIWPLYEI